MALTRPTEMEQTVGLVFNKAALTSLLVRWFSLLFHGLGERFACIVVCLLLALFVLKSNKLAYGETINRITGMPCSYLPDM